MTVLKTAEILVESPKKHHSIIAMERQMQNGERILMSFIGQSSLPGVVVGEDGGRRGGHGASKGGERKW